VGASLGTTVPADISVAGLPLLRRIALCAERAGFGRVLVQDSGHGVPRVLAGTVATPLTAAGSLTGTHRIVILAADVVPQPQWLQTLRAAPIEPDTLYTDGAGVATIDSDDAAPMLAVLGEAATAAAMVEALRRRFPAVEGTFEVSGRFRLASAGDVPRAESWLLRSLIKDNEGFMSRHLERRVSLAITRRLIGTGVTPNAMTIISLLIGLAAAPFFLSATWPWQLAGALLFLLHSIVDGCDGELARLTFRESHAGALLDFWGDNVVHVAIFACLAVGWSRAAGAAWPLLLGVVSTMSALAAASIVSGHMMRGARPAPAGSLLGRLLGALAHRDFIYVVVGLAAFGKAFWFLVLSAIGTPLFVLLLVLSGARAHPVDAP
jgi:1L-myo-inositol 1-phosphate cytidylyltransferase / CDP-L-myo-inositol myo-inositolphosphotransferase